MKPFATLLLASACFISLVPEGFAQKKNAQASSTTVYDTSLFNGLRWRNIGPWRGGRCLAVTGIMDQPGVYYSGAVGGGIWKTTDDGDSWFSISDSTFHSSSVGALAVAPSNPNIIYAG